ncbi:MAG: urease accessory protein UreE [Pseudomonadota bacterium]
MTGDHPQMAPSDTLPRAHTLTNTPGEAQLTVRLSYDDRHRRRLVVSAVDGTRVLIDLAKATRLRSGDTLAMDDGRTLKIAAEDEPVADIFAADERALRTLAWHLGNRHTPTAILADRLRIRRDHVLEDMARRLGAQVTTADAPFDPEPGAYHGEGHHHHHHHDDDDD